VAAAALAAVVAAAAQAGSVTRHPVVVVSKKSYRLLAWDNGRKICTQIVAVGRSSSACGSPRALSFEQLPYAVGSETFVGGVTTSRARTVDVVFANGATLHLKARTGRRYQGRRAGHVRFFAGREKSVSTVASITAKNGRGRRVQSVQIAPPAPPQLPPQQCGCPPPNTARACPLVCPYAEPAWTSNS
jgi:hypothetical protein